MSTAKISAFENAVALTAKLYDQTKTASDLSQDYRSETLIALQNAKGVAATVANVASLKEFAFDSETPAANGFPIYLQGYETRGDGGGGQFYVDTSDTTTAENGVTVFVTTSGLRIKRILDVPYLKTSWSGMKSDYNRTAKTGTDNKTRFENLVDVSADLDMPIFVDGDYMIRGGNKSILNVRLVGDGMDQSGIFNTLDSSGNLFNVEDGGSVTAVGVTISRYNQTFNVLQNLKHVDFRSCRFTDNRREVLFSRGPAGFLLDATINRIHMEGNEFENCLPFRIRSKFNSARIVNNDFKNITIDTGIWGGDADDIDLFAISIGAAFNADNTVDWDQSQQLMGNVVIVGNTIDGVQGDASGSKSDRSRIGINVTGNNVVISGNTIKNVYGTNTTTHTDAAAIYVKCYNANISNNPITNCGADLGEGAITVKGQFRDGSKDSALGLDGRAFSIGIFGNVIINTLERKFKSGIFINNHSEITIQGNIVDGYKHGIFGIANNTKVSDNTYNNITEEIWLSSSGLPIKNYSIESETIQNYKPTSTYICDLRMDDGDNICIKDIKADIDLTGKTGSFIPFRVRGDNAESVMHNVTIDNIKLDFKNSALAGGQQFFISSESQVDVWKNCSISNIKITTDGAEIWQPKPTSAFYRDVIATNFTYNGFPVLGLSRNNGIRYTEEYAELYVNLTGLPTGLNVVGKIPACFVYKAVVFVKSVPTSGASTATIQLRISPNVISDNTIVTGFIALESFPTVLNGDPANGIFGSAINDIIINVGNEALTGGEFLMRFYYIGA